MAESTKPSRTGSVSQVKVGKDEKRRGTATVSSLILPHLRRIYDENGASGRAWNRDEINNFFRKVQHHDPMDPITDLLDRDSFDFESFLEYMTSSLPAINVNRTSEDLTWPLSNYFISSSHNTYLSGNQLYSQSTTASYTNVLLRGCRCVEIDVWDGIDHDLDSSSDGLGDDPEARQRSLGEKKMQKRLKRQDQLHRIEENLPPSVTSVAHTLKRTSLGKKIETKLAERLKVDLLHEESNDNPQEIGSRDTCEAVEVEPRVLHGHTLTKEVPFRDVCVAIRESAFTTSNLPVIISLEVHCGLQQQSVMVKIMNEVWKDYLVPEPVNFASTLPSPGELRNKILVKVKYSPPSTMEAGAVAIEADFASKDSIDSQQEQQQEQQGDSDDEFIPEAPAGASAGMTQETQLKQMKKKKPSKIIQELSRMGVFTKGISFKSLTQPEASMPTHIFSLSEKKFLDLVGRKAARADLAKHNREFMMRAYPSGLRISSSNLNPPMFWGYGTQIVALNWQQTDEGMMLNHGMFSGTDGYVLKPEGYRSGPRSDKLLPIQRRTLNLTIAFLVAESIPLPLGDKSSTRFHPYVKVELHVDACKIAAYDEGRDGVVKTDGHERDGDFKSRTHPHTGTDFDLAGDKIIFKNITGLVEELTFVRFTVRDHEIGRDDLAGWACVRLDRLGSGYRMIHLTDSKGMPTDGRLFVKVGKSLVV